MTWTCAIVSSVRCQMQVADQNRGDERKYANSLLHMTGAIKTLYGIRTRKEPACHRQGARCSTMEYRLFHARRRGYLVVYRNLDAGGFMGGELVLVTGGSGFIGAHCIVQ